MTSPNPPFRFASLHFTPSLPLSTASFAPQITCSQRAPPSNMAEGGHGFRYETACSDGGNLFQGPFGAGLGVFDGDAEGFEAVEETELAVAAAVDAWAVVVILAGETTDTVFFAASSVTAHSGMDEASSPQPVKVIGAAATIAANNAINTFFMIKLLCSAADSCFCS